MKGSPQLFFFVLLTSQIPPASGQVDVSADLEKIRVRFHMPGLSAMAVKNGRLVAQGAAGYRRQGDNWPLLISDRINIGSCTKWMTATVAGRLVDRGQIGWSTRVRDLFTNYENFNPAFFDVTLDQLLAHRAGIEDRDTFENRHWSQLMTQNGTISRIRRWVAESVLKDAPQVRPGEYLYSNQGYAVAAAMLEMASGKNWETLIKEEVFRPVGMKTATLGIVYDDKRPPKNPVGHYLTFGATLPVPEEAMVPKELYRYQASNGAGGFVICTLQDWTKFLSIHAGNSNYLSRNTAKRLREAYPGPPGPDGENYGRGVFVDDRDWARPGPALDHNGDIFGHETVFWMAPARGFIGVVFTNCFSRDKSTFRALDSAAVLVTPNDSFRTGKLRFGEHPPRSSSAQRR